MVVIVTVAVHLPHKKLIQPEFLCGCGRPAASRKCLGGEHNGRMFYRCGNGWVESSDGLNEKLWWKRVSKFTFPFLEVYIFCNIAPCFKIWISTFQHLGCEVFVWEDFIQKFAETVFEYNQLGEDELESEIIGTIGARTSN